MLACGEHHFEWTQRVVPCMDFPTSGSSLSFVVAGRLQSVYFFSHLEPDLSIFWQLRFPFSPVSTYNIVYSFRAMLFAKSNPKMYLAGNPLETEGELPCSGGPSCAGKGVYVQDTVTTAFSGTNTDSHVLWWAGRCLDFCVIVQLTMCAWVYFGALYTYVSLSVSVPYCFGYCSFGV